MLIGVVGKPNVGKSTFFKAATLAEVEIANYPFATIKPNSAVGYVKIDCVDKFFNTQCNPRTGYCSNHHRFIPVQMMDVAGLVPGAHKGLGMGNQFLDDLRQADVLVHVIDVSGSTNEKGEPIAPLSYDPAEDIKFLEVELDMWYFQILKKGWEKFARTIQQTKGEISQALAKQLSGLKVEEEQVKDVLKKLELSEDIISWQEDELMLIAKELRKVSKPMIIAANKIDVNGVEKNLDRLRKEFPDYIIIPCSAESELALKEASRHNLIEYVPGENNFKILSELNDKQEKALKFIKDNILDKFGSTGVQKVINSSVFDLLKYIAVYPGGVNKLADSEGNILPDCFLLPDGSTALDFAYKLHTDFGKNFIRAIDVKTKQTIGKEHKLKHLDVIEIISNK
ncbi:redox-regulated ATPase YchF [Candidatus Woesearchaeota archaeon]|nr:MAG: redox-regulated ATPase YchF [Candidatus Woesearchaeota archaeon]